MNGTVDKMHIKSMYRKNLLSLFALPVMLLTGIPVSADELLMKDGSRLQGKVVKKEDGILEFKTGFAGVIKVQWAEVSELHADEPVTVMLENDETVSAATIRNTKKVPGNAREARWENRVAVLNRTSLPSSIRHPGGWVKASAGRGG